MKSKRITSGLDFEVRLQRCGETARTVSHALELALLPIEGFRISLPLAEVESKTCHPHLLWGTPCGAPSTTLNVATLNVAAPHS